LIWAARVAEAAMLLAEGDPGTEAAAGRAAELGLPSAPVAAGAHLPVGGSDRRAWGSGCLRVVAVDEHRGLEDPGVAASVREVLPADPDAAVLVGFGERSSAR
jgi:hypothetical protein